MSSKAKNREVQMLSDRFDCTNAEVIQMAASATRHQQMTWPTMVMRLLVLLCLVDELDEPRFSRALSRSPKIKKPSANTRASTPMITEAALTTVIREEDVDEMSATKSVMTATTTAVSTLTRATFWYFLAR